MSLRDTILAAEDIPSEVITVKEWGVDVLVKGMSASERIALTKSAYDQQTGEVNMAVVYPDIIVACVFDPDTGERVFTEADKTAILGKSSAAVEFVAGAGMRLSGIGKQEQDEAGKDSSVTPSGDSSSNSLNG